jgi:ribonuclease J
MEGIMRSAAHTIFATAISSNIGRFQQMINIAQRLNRKVILVGRSIQKKVEIAHELGYMKIPRNLIVSLRDSKRLKRNELMYIIAGCYGQVGSSLYRLSLGEYERVEIAQGDTVIFSADPAPPYTKESQNFVVDNLIDKGVDVHYYDLKEGFDGGIYISGHGAQEDITELFRMFNPKHFVPIGGEIRYMKSYLDLAVKFGADPKDVYRLKPGENLIFEKGKVRMGEKISTKRVLVHGRGIGDVGKVVLGDRAVLGNEGVVVAVFKLGRNKKLSSRPEIVSRGFVFEKISKKLLTQAEKRLADQVKKKGKFDKKSLNEAATDYLSNFFYQKTGRRPMILPVVVEV